MVGIYRIEIKANNGIRVYVGQAEDLENREKIHFKDLRGNYHFNVRVQRCYNKYGKQNCQFIIQESVLNNDKIYLAQREQHWKDYWVDEIGEENVLNLREIYPVQSMSEETKQKMSKAASKKVGEKNSFYGKKHTEETKKKISAARSGKLVGKDHPLYGKNRTKETKRKISRARKGLKHSEETRKKMSEARKGKKLSKEHREKLAAAQVGEKNHNAKLTWEQVREMRRRYEEESISQRDLAKEYGIHFATISDIINNKRWKVKNENFINR